MEIDIAEIERELSSLTAEEMKEQLLSAKVKQKVATKKYYNADSAKKARQKRAEKLKQMAELAKAQPASAPGYANLYEQIVAEANALADERLAEDEVGDEETAAV